VEEGLKKKKEKKKDMMMMRRMMMGAGRIEKEHKMKRSR
jgi:hypothetical protein